MGAQDDIAFCWRERSKRGRWMNREAKFANAFDMEAKGPILCCGSLACASASANRWRRVLVMTGFHLEGHRG